MHGDRDGDAAMKRLARLVATVGGLGRLPAPGTWGALAAIPLTWGLHAGGGFPLVLMVTLGLFLAGSWAARAYAPPGSDPGEVVIDEVVGQMIALWPLSWGMGVAAARDAAIDPAAFPWPGWVAGFLLFRFFDVLKPPPVSWADRMHGWLGIMLDDVVAGFLAGAIVLIAAGIAHGGF